MSVIEEIAAERRRQIEAEGWTPDHDDADEREGQLAGAAACYAFGEILYTGEPSVPGVVRNAATVWPWAERFWKPKDRRRNLIRAAALIVAEVERMDRARAPSDAQMANDSTSDTEFRQFVQKIADGTYEKLGRNPITGYNPAKSMDLVKSDATRLLREQNDPVGRMPRHNHS